MAHVTVKFQLSTLKECNLLWWASPDRTRKRISHSKWTWMTGTCLCPNLLGAVEQSRNSVQNQFPLSAGYRKDIGGNTLGRLYASSGQNIHKYVHTHIHTYSLKKTQKMYTHTKHLRIFTVISSHTTHSTPPPSPRLPPHIFPTSASTLFLQ